jgi:hypothetical protein
MRSDGPHAAIACDNCTELSPASKLPDPANAINSTPATRPAAAPTKYRSCVVMMLILSRIKSMPFRGSTSVPKKTLKNGENPRVRRPVERTAPTSSRDHRGGRIEPHNDVPMEARDA